VSRILLLGGKGRLGAMLARKWGERHEVRSLARPEVDVSDLPALKALLEGSSYDILLNGTALTNVDRCESDRYEAQTVNALAPKLMSEDAAAKGARFIHISTDYVFDGVKGSAYSESDPGNPMSHYGRTKLEGEDFTLQAAPQHLVFRVSWVFGPDKPSFVDMIVDRSIKGEKLEAIADKTSSPTFSADVAEWIEPFFDPALPGGLFHACNSGSCSWREWGEHALRKARELGVPVTSTEIRPIGLADMKAFVAPRPPHTEMSVAKLAQATGFPPRSWQEAVDDYLQQKFS
jgi:dTDP-4-dehydrorhamnose reductase